MKTLSKITTLLLMAAFVLAAPAESRADEDPEDLYKKIVRSCAFVVVPMSEGYAMATGTLVDADKRILVTSYSVARHGEYCYCQFPVYQKDGSMMTDKSKYIERVKLGDAIKATVLYTDSSRNLAILKLARLPAGTPAIPMASKGAATGGTVLSIGNSGAVEQLFGTTEGQVRAVGDQEFITGTSPADAFKVKARVVTTTNATNSGDSGGPLYNKKGELVGISSVGHKAANLVSLYIDVSEVKSFLDEKKIVLKEKPPVDPKLVSVPKKEPKEEPKTGTNPPAKDVSADEKTATALLSAAKAYSKDEDLRAKYVAKLNEIITKYPTTATAKEAKRLLDGLK